METSRKGVQDPPSQKGRGPSWQFSRNLIAWWHNYTELGNDYGDVKWAHMCHKMKETSASAKGIMTAYNDTYDDEESIENLIHNLIN